MAGYNLKKKRTIPIVQISRWVVNCIHVISPKRYPHSAEITLGSQLLPRNLTETRV